MGRQKKAPVRLALHDEASSTRTSAGSSSSSARGEVLGRFVHNHDDGGVSVRPSLDMMLAAEVARDTERRMYSKDPLEDSEEEDSWDPGQAAHPLEDSDDDDETPFSVRRTIPPVLAEIERKIAAREQESRKKIASRKRQKPNSSVKKKWDSRKRQVQFESLEESAETNIPLELVLDSQDTPASTTLRVVPLQRNLQSDEDLFASLTTFEFPNTTVQLPNRLLSCSLHSETSFRLLWTHFNLPSEIIDNNFNFLSDLIKCIDAEWICATLNAESRSLRLSATKKAAMACRDLPLVQKKGQIKKFDLHNALQRVICGLFRIPKATPIFSSDLRSKEELTAKHVYDLVDNKQLERFVADQNIFPKLVIPGLVPTLRPYQAAAVQWMLQRESLTEVGDEWKVAWMALDPERRLATPLIQAEYQNHTSLQNIFFYCPFNGWIASSLQEAQLMTLSGRTSPVKGGCLAESMGLGKTVELLACVLAHRMPAPVAAGPSCQRRLLFEENGTGTAEDEIAIERSAVGVVVDAMDFADEDSSDEDSVLAEKRLETFGSEACRQTSTKINMVTPEKDHVPVEERWIDEIEVGSCICGEIISFPSDGKNQKNMIVLCKGCDEPMHLHCTCLGNSNISALKRVNLRRTFGNETLECVWCEDCPCCIVANRKEKIRSRATVIVCPPAILDQWEREVKRHTRSANGEPLKVKVYEGVDCVSKSSPKRQMNVMQLLHPHFLADADIILIPFGALMSDLGHSDDNRYISQNDEDGWASLSGLRKRKKYRVVPSPLLSVHFWRVAIDEAQRVEVTTAKAAKMALKLQAEHFWAVSGTPVGHGKLEDLYGLLLFLGLAPCDDRQWFKSCLSPVVEGLSHRIVAVLKDCFWRSTKASKIIKEQLGIPTMTEKRVVLKFSSIERHFYSTQLSKTLGLVGHLDPRTDMGTKKQMDRLAESVQRLRAACCHPQVGIHGVTGGRLERARQADGDSVAARVLSMEQILDKFIDDSRQKCEEAQRLAIMHTNAMAAITRLKIDARSRGVRVDEDDRTLLMKSGDTYRESIALAEQNATPEHACGEAVVTGNVGFLSPNRIMNGGCFKLTWKMKSDTSEVWATFDFQGPAKKIKELRFKPRLTVPNESGAENSAENSWKVAIPEKVLLQVALASDGGEFVDVVESPIREDGAWSVVQKFPPTNRSRAWRIVVKVNCSEASKIPPEEKIDLCVGLDVQLFEARIDGDSLQLLHSLYNSSLAYESALQLEDRDGDAETSVKLYEQVDAMRQEAMQIESLYKARPKVLHKTCMERFKELIEKRKRKEEDLSKASSQRTTLPNDLTDGLEDGWFNDFLSAVSLFGSDEQQHSVLERIMQDIDGIYVEDSAMRFPDFSDLAGLRAALGVRLTKIRAEGLGKKQTTLPATTADNEFVQIRSSRYKCSVGEHARCMASIEALSANPSSAELEENSQCRLCKADWNQTGPICKHCRIADVLQDLRPDSVTVAVFSAIYSAVRTPTAIALLEERGLSHIVDRAKFFFELLEVEEREKVGAWKMWRAHLQLLNDYDELASTKQSTRLSQEGEDLTRYTEDQLNAIIQPIDLMAKYHDHAAKQAMSLGDLRRTMGTLRYLQNQRSDSVNEYPPENCVVCLQILKGECCVLKCGHRFHEKPCFDHILRINVGPRVHCPLKCRELTQKKEVMVSTDKSKNDGSRSNRSVKGSFGTKVTRVVSDILTMKDKGEKGIIFSQWLTMLEIVEAALWENGVTTARPRPGKKFKEGLRQFEAPECAVLLLPLKQGAEGLTLVQATNIFMIEPVMNSGLDQQAVNRIHRIGQTRKCFVWRYLIEDTIEMKIDRIRLKHLEEADVVEDSLKATRKADQYSAGGCDGGFASKEELIEMLE